MPRKKTAQPEETSSFRLKFREKRKWQITLRRYVLEKSPCPYYAPYFGLDIENIRKWFEYQFQEGVGWDSFGVNWQFEHIVPVTYFDFSDDEELKMCWNFINLRVDLFQLSKEGGNRMDFLAAKTYFRDLFEKTNYDPCKKLLNKISQIEITGHLNTDAQYRFLKDHAAHLRSIDGYSAFEFELLNSGRTTEEIKKEVSFLKNLGGSPHT